MNMKIKVTKTADYNDICKELVRRGLLIVNPVWTTRQGKEIPLSEMTDQHLLNVYHLLEKQMEDEDILDHIGDADPMDWYD